MALIRGFVAPFRGAVFIGRHGLWGYLVLPLLVNAAVAGLSVWLGAGFVRRKVGEELFVSSPLVAWTGLVVLAAVAGLLIFVVLQPVVGGPFVDILSENAESVVCGRAPSVGLLRSGFSAALHGLLKAVLYAFALAVVLILGAVSAVGGILGMALYAIFLAFDGFDYPLSRRGASFADKWRYLARHPGQTIGFCAGVSLLYLVPLAAIVAPAFAAVGATLAYLDAEPAR